MSATASGYVTAMMWPALNASCAPTRNTTVPTSAASTENSAPKRRLGSGATSAISTIRAMFTQSGTGRSGTCSSSVWIAFAWISGPGISPAPDVEVA